MKALNNELRENSSSGGIFSLLAGEIIKNSGKVYGAAFDKDYRGVHHEYIEDIKNIGRLRGSKYVQSSIGHTYKEVKKDLEKNRKVLFSGTPCQIAGLYAYLGKDYDNLITQDIVCHGVPSPLIWKKYMDFREKEADSKINDVTFRNKKMGWRNYSLNIQFLNNKTYRKCIEEDLYLYGFTKNFF